MKTDNKELYENLPEGYLEQRRKRDLRYVWSLYTYCVFSALANYGILPIKGGAFTLLFVVIMGINMITMMTSYTNKRIYNNIPIPNHGDIKIFTKKEVLLYVLPIIVMLPFVLGRIRVYLVTMGFAYLACSRFTRPMDALDKASQRRY